MISVDQLNIKALLCMQEKTCIFATSNKDGMSFSP